MDLASNNFSYLAIFQLFILFIHKRYIQSYGPRLLEGKLQVEYGENSGKILRLKILSLPRLATVLYGKPFVSK